MNYGVVLWGIKSIYYVLDYKTNKTYKCVIKSKILDIDNKIKNRIILNPLVCGDEVEFEIIDNNNGLILKRYDRKNEFSRLKNNGREIQTIVANVDQIVIIDSISNPPIRPFFIDRLLFTADYKNIPAIIVFNKYDLLGKDPQNDKIFYEVEKIYKNLNYTVLKTSIKTNEGIEQLKEILKNKKSSFQGKSGAGKSSLIKLLDPTLENIKIGEISKKYDRGVHTTTFAQMYLLNFGAMVIDTPGIRELSIYLDKPEDVEKYFRDFKEYRTYCKFQNCQHIDEPDCAIKKYLLENKISQLRYESYLRIRETIIKLADSKI